MVRTRTAKQTRRRARESLLLSEGVEGDDGKPCLKARGMSGTWTKEEHARLLEVGRVGYIFFFFLSLLLFFNPRLHVKKHSSFPLKEESAVTHTFTFPQEIYK